MGKVPTVRYGRRGAENSMVKDFQVPILFLVIKNAFEQVTKTLDFKIVKWLGLNDGKTTLMVYTVESPALKRTNR